MISNIGWTLRADNSPWSLSLKTTLPGIKFGVAVGDILVTPAYGYTNRVPEIVPLSFLVIYGKEEIDRTMMGDQILLKLIYVRRRRAPGVKRRAYHLKYGPS